MSRPRASRALENAAREPEVLDLARCLIAMGARIGNLLNDPGPLHLLAMLELLLEHGIAGRGDGVEGRCDSRQCVVGGEIDGGSAVDTDGWNGARIVDAVDVGDRRPARRRGP